MRRTRIAALPLSGPLGVDLSRAMGPLGPPPGRSPRATFLSHGSGASVVE